MFIFSRNLQSLDKDDNDSDIIDTELAPPMEMITWISYHYGARGMEDVRQAWQD